MTRRILSHPKKKKVKDVDIQRIDKESNVMVRDKLRVSCKYMILAIRLLLFSTPLDVAQQPLCVDRCGRRGGG